MKACTCFLLFGAFAYTNPSPVTTPTEDKRGSNVTRKRVPELNIKENTHKTVIGNNKIPQAHSAVETYTDFMRELVIILNTYNDDIFEDFVHIIDKELKKYPYRSQDEFKNLLSEESNLLMRKSVSAQRAVINQLVDMMKLLKIFDSNIRELLDYINSLYRNDAKKKFRKILKDLKRYTAGYGNSRTKNDFVRLIRECVRASVFIHTNLNTDVKRKLKKHIDIFMKKIKEFPSSASSTANLTNFKPTISKSNTYTVTITENISTEDQTTKPSLKINPTKTTALIKKENKRTRIFRANTTVARQEDATITLLETSKRDESKSQQMNITHSTTNETATEVMFYMMTEKPGIFYKSEIKSKLVERMFEEESTERQAPVQATTTTVKRLMTKKALHRNRALPLPGEELYEEIFDREKRMRSQTRTSKFTTERPELKEYLKRMRQLRTEVDRLKVIDEINRYSKPYKDVENNGIDEDEKKDNKPSNNRKEGKDFKQSYEYEANVQRGKNKVSNTEEVVKKTNTVSKDGQDLRRSAEIVDDGIHHHLPSFRNHSNKLWILKKTNTINNSEKTTKAAETSTKTNKYESKKLILRSSEPLLTAEENSANKKLPETKLKTTKKVDNTALNVSEEIKQSRIDETATKGIIKITKDIINETTTAHSFRRLVEAFPSLFDDHSVKQGLYPAHLWQ